MGICKQVVNGELFTAWNEVEVVRTYYLYIYCWFNNWGKFQPESKDLLTFAVISRNRLIIINWYDSNIATLKLEGSVPIFEITCFPHKLSLTNKCQLDNRDGTF